MTTDTARPTSANRIVHGFLPNRRDLGQIALITLGQLLLMAWALRLVAPESGIPLIWLPNGFLLGCLVLLPTRLWPLLLVVIGVSVFGFQTLTTDRPALAILWFPLTNLLATALGAALFRRFAGGSEGFRSFAQLTAFIGLCVLLVPALASAIGAEAVVRHGLNGEYWTVYTRWFSSIGLGILSVTPLVIEGARWRREGGWRQERALLLTLVVMALILLAAAWFNVTAHLDGHLSVLISFPLLGWAAIQFGLRGGISGAAVLVIVSVQLSALGLGPFNAQTQHTTEAVFHLQAHLAAIVLAALFVSVAVDNLRQSSAALAEASARFQALFDHSPISLWEEDFSAVKAHLDDLRRGGISDIAAWLRQHPEEVVRCAQKVKILAINDRTLSMFGASSKPQLLERLQDLFDDQSLAVFRDELIALDAGAVEFRAESPQRKSTGERFHSITGVVVEPGHQSDWSRVVVSIEDISAQAQAEQELAQSKAMLEELFHSLDAGVVVHAPDTRILLSNPRADQLLGLTRDEMLDRTAFDERWEFLDNAGQPLATEDFPINQVLRSGAPLTSLIIGIRRAVPGDLVWVLVNGAPLFDATGAISRVLVSFVDITELRQSKQRLRESAAVFASTSEGVTITDLDGTIRDVNDAFCAITGYSRHEVIGQNPRVLQSGRHDRTYYQAMWQSLHDTGHWRGEIWNRRKDGAVYPELLTISTVRNHAGEATGYIAVFSDITALKDSEQQLHHLAHHDPLTGLPNRLLLLDRLEQGIKHAQRQQTLLAVGFIDLDRFKHINDSLGHAFGDQLLQQLAERLVGALRGGDTLARIGGDEFLLLLEDLTDAEDAAIATEKLMEIFTHPVTIGGHEVYVTASIGLSLYPNDGREPSTLLRNADAAMYRAKDEGRNTYQFYSTELTQAAFEHLFLESALRNALAAREMHLVYQPQVNLLSGDCVGFEALLRWRHPQQGMISPARFIPIAEQSGLIREIGAWVLETACRQGRTWLDQGFKFGRIAVNVAGPQLIDGQFRTLVEQVLEKTGLPPCHLALEVTESFVMRRLGVSIEHLAALRAFGIEIAIDDFGTGYSSLSYLKQLPIDKLKIDRSFVRDIPDDTNDMAITEAIIALGKALKLKLVAEGVETDVQAEFLRSRGCGEAQGYLFDQPLLPQAIAERGLLVKAGTPS